MVSVATHLHRDDKIVFVHHLHLPELQSDELSLSALMILQFIDAFQDAFQLTAVQLCKSRRSVLCHSAAASVHQMQQQSHGIGNDRCLANICGSKHLNLHRCYTLQSHRLFPSVSQCCL